MSRDEIRIAEAVAALTARLEGWDVEDAATKAAAYVNDMLRNGWRPRALPVMTESTTGHVSPPTDAYRQARASCRAPATEETA